MTAICETDSPASREDARPTTRLSRLSSALFSEVDSAGLGVWRIGLGLMVLWQAAVYYWPRTWTWHYAADVFHFPYAYFEWVRPWPEPGMQLTVIAQGLAAAGVALGYRYRFSAAVLFITYTHLFLIDETHYNNHYYLFCLIFFWLIFLSPHRSYSLDRNRSDRKLKADAKLGPAAVPRWQVMLLQFHIVLAYFFGGVAKLNGDWLRGEPMQKFLDNAAVHPLGEWLASLPGSAYAFAYGGLVFDLAIGFLLCGRRTRLWALSLLIGFHVCNAYMFTIGIFPWMMLFSTILFIEPARVRRSLARLRAVSSQPQASRRRTNALTADGGAELPRREPVSLRQRLLLAALACYVAIQCLLPLRHFLYPGHTDWTKEGQKFAWRMKIASTRGHVRFWVVDKRTGMREAIDQRSVLAFKQRYFISDEPRTLAVFARFVRSELEQTGRRDFEIRCEAVASLNGRPFQYLIDPAVDLSRVDISVWRRKPWIVPLEPNQPIGDYAPNLEEEMRRVAEVVGDDSGG